MFRRLRHRQSAPDEIYSSSLETLYLGRALWYPEPHKSGELQIGDVGFIRRGAFIRLFNLDTSTPENKVPSDYWPKQFDNMEPLPPHVLQIDERSRSLGPGHYCSHGVESKNIHALAGVTTSTGVSATLSGNYACKAVHGAALVLQSEAHEKTIYENRTFKKYIIRNHPKWYTYARDGLSQDIKQDDIVVVSGWVKTKADWVAAAFSNTSTSFGASLEGHVGGIAGVEVGGSHTSSVTGPKMHRHGEHYVINESDIHPREVKRDQSVFLSRYKVRRRLLLPWKVVAGAGYHRPPGPGDARGGLGDEGVMAREAEDVSEVDMLERENEGEDPDPLDVLLDYILEISAVETAIASDSDVLNIVGGSSVIDFASYLRQVQPPVDVEGTVGSLSMEDVVSHERERAFARRTTGIAASDLKKWSGITSKDGCHLEDLHVLISGPMEDQGRPLTRKLKHFVFAHSRDSYEACSCSALSADGKFLAASFFTNDVLVWRLSDGLLVQRLQRQGHTSNFNSLSFPSNNHTLISGSLDGSAIIWDVRSGHVLLHSKGHNKSLATVAYSPHGSLIVTASNGDKSVKIWDVLTGACLHSFRADEEVHELAFSTDGTRLYIKLFKSCLLYNVQTYAHIATLRHVSGEALTWSMSRQGDRIVTASGYQVKIWSAVTGEEILAVDHPKQLSSPVAFSPDGAEVLVGCDAYKTAVTYSSRTGQLRRVFKLSESRAYHALYSPDGDYAVFGNVDNELEVFDTKSRALLAKFKAGGDIGDLQFVPDTQTLLIRCKDRPLRLCSIQDIMRMR